MLSRRQFLALGASTAAAYALDPERALWVPGARTFFLPPERSVIGAAVGDIEALVTAIGGPLILGRGRGWAEVYTDPQTSLTNLSDREVELLLDRGRRMVAQRRGLVIPDRAEIARGWKA